MTSIADGNATVILDRSPTGRDETRSGHSCSRCARRKVKCDRQRPCTACKKHQVSCSYEVCSDLSLHRRKRLKQQALIERLNDCESILASHGIGRPLLLESDVPRGARNTEGNVEQFLPSPKTIVDAHNDSTPNLNKVRIIHGQGRSRLVNK